MADKKYPSVTVGINTFGREHLLYHRVKEFFAQDYPGKMELIIFNDDHDIIFYHPDERVRTINYNRRFKNVDDKKLLMRHFSRCELFVLWADDDIWEPWAISTMVKYLGDKNIMWFWPIYKKQPGYHAKRNTTLTSVLIYRNSWVFEKDLPPEHSVKFLKANSPEDFNEKQLTPKEVFMTWMVYPKRRRSWRPSEPEKYKIKYGRTQKVVDLRYEIENNIGCIV